MRRGFKNCEIKQVIGKGKGVVARRDFKAGEVVVRGRIVRRVKKRTNYSFQVDWQVHVDLDEPARLLNHSCEPNCGIRRNVFGGYDFMAMRRISRGEELEWDYCMSEYESIAVKKCLCGSKQCRGKVRGYRYLGEEIKKKYGGLVAPYLKE